MKCCPKCFLKQEKWVLVCDCGYDFDLQEIKEPSFVQLASPNVVASQILPVKYTSLRSISSYFNILAWLNLAGSIIVAVFFLKNSSIVPCVVATVWGISVFVANAAAAELIMLAIDVEENLRKMILLQEKSDNKK